jgi:phosphoethanolamine N-methyltransferase
MISFGSGAYGMSNDENIEYSDQDIIEFEAMFGAGFLSSGGQEEVAKIVENVDLVGKEVLDIGVGIGGPACLLVEEHGAARVTGIDVAASVLEKAAQIVLRRGLQDRVVLKRVEPGPLPFDDESFDVVFSKDAIAHIHDKGALFREIYRVLRPGGCVAMSDWYRSEDPFTEEMAAWLGRFGSDFAMTPIQNDADLLGPAGFVDTAVLDRNAWFAEFSRKLADHMRGPGHDTLVEILGKDIAENLTSKAETRAIISAQGQLRPGHLRGTKPVQGKA